MVRVKVSIRYLEEEKVWRAFAPKIEGMEVIGKSLPDVLNNLYAMLEQHFDLQFDSVKEVVSSSSCTVVDLPATVEKEVVY
jgi:predicted RNase H-like HicB family nuclease